MARNREKTVLFRMLWTVLATPMHAVASFRWQGLENVPASGSFLVVPNHVTNADPPTVGMALWRAGRPPHYLAKASLWRAPILGFFMKRTGQIPVERGGATRGADAMAAAGRVAAEGGAVVVYPEGSLTRDPDGWPMRGKTGAARIALAARIPVIPCAHWGDQAILPPNGGRPRLWPRPRVVVRFGPALDLSPYYDRPLDKVVLDEVTDLIMAAIVRELEVVRGETAPAERWDPVAHGQTETGRF